MRIATALTALAAVALAGPALAHGDPDFAQDRDSVIDYDDDASNPNPLVDDEHYWSAHGGIGFGLDPSSFAFGAGLEYHVMHELSVGPLLQVLARDDQVIVAPTANVRYHFDLSHLDSDFASRLEPFVQGGLGLVYVDEDRPDRDDTEFLLNGGFGLDYRIDERISVGSTLMFNGIPGGDKAVRENFFFTWQVVGMRYHF